jgi:hypothetical protein
MTPFARVGPGADMPSNSHSTVSVRSSPPSAAAARRAEVAPEVESECFSLAPKGRAMPILRLVAIPSRKAQFGARAPRAAARPTARASTAGEGRAA